MGLEALESERELRRALELLDDQEFEQIVHAVVRLEFPEVRKLRPPDFGADSLLLDAATGARVWQAKHFSGSVRWSQCVDSQTRALKEWSPTRLTFVFGKDLTGPQQKTFAAKLVDAAPQNVIVDWWGTTELLDRLRADDAGERVARRFLNFRPSSDLQQAIRAQGELTSGRSVVDRALATAEFANSIDPQYMIRASAGIGTPEPAPDNALRLQRLSADGNATAVLDAFPRFPGSTDPVGGVIRFDDSDAGRAAAEKFNAALKLGGTVDLAGAGAVAFHGLPVAFEDILGAEELTHAAVTVVRKPWPARWILAGPLGISQLDFDFFDGGDENVRTATRGGLTVTLTLLPGKNALNVGWNYSYSLQHLPATSELPVLRFMRALNQGGHAQLVARDNETLTLDQKFKASDPDPLTDQIADYLESLRLIEEHIDQDLGDGGNAFERDGYTAVFQAAAALKQGGRSMSLSEWCLTVDPKPGGVDALVASVEAGQCHLEDELVNEFTIQGQPVSLGRYSVPIPPSKLVSRKANTDDQTLVDLTFEPLPGAQTVFARLKDAS